jgi:hypothetical protein
MFMTTTLKLLMAVFLVLGIVAVSLVITLNFSNPKEAHGSAPGGFQTELATTSSRRVNIAERFMFASSTCLARIVTTGEDNIVIGFGHHASGTLRHEVDRGGLNGTFQIGHLQPASTTVSYDAGTYGCGYWTFIGASTGVDSTINISELTGFK